MDGDKTMSFVRMRKDDPEGDFGRTTSQRKVIEGILQEGASVGSVPKIKSMTEVLGNNMSTNMDFADMKKLFSGYRDTRKNVRSEEHTSELQSRFDLVCRLLLENKKQTARHQHAHHQP